VNTISVKARRLLALSFLKGVGPMALRHVAALPSFVDEADREVALRVSRVGKAMSEVGAWSAAQQEAERQEREARARDARITCFLDPEYPELLLATPDAPPILYVRGHLPSTTQSIAVIGTRHPTEHGTTIATRITQYLVQNGQSVVSGLALGCDATAHTAALAHNGHTVAVLAHGLQIIAPASHKKLASDIVESGGALVTQYPFGTEPLPAQFVQRDKTQAGLARGTVMIQSDVQGGSLHASRASIGYGRWLAVPFPTERDRAAGEPKIGANLLLSGDDAAAKTQLLKCSVSDLDRIVILRDRSDYPLLLSDGPFHASPDSLPMDQPSLL
jgi:DNA processing protein